MEDSAPGSIIQILGLEALTTLGHAVVEFAHLVRTHLVIEVEGNGNGRDGLAFGPAAKGRAAPIAIAAQFLLSLAALFLEQGDDAAGVAVLAAVVDDRALLAVKIFLYQELLFTPTLR